MASTLWFRASVLLTDAQVTNLFGGSDAAAIADLESRADAALGARGWTRDEEWTERFGRQMIVQVGQVQVAYTAETAHADPSNGTRYSIGAYCSRP